MPKYLQRLIASVRGRLYGLKSKSIRELPFDALLNGEFKQLVHSGFNTDWLVELGIKPRVIVDLGSFDGGDAYRFKKTFPSARVVTVEADPTRYKIVKDTLMGEDIETFNYAACAIDAEIDWYTSTIDGEINAQGSIYQHSEAYKKKFPTVKQTSEPCKVLGRRFDTFAKEQEINQIDLLHMDIEGAEHNVLQTLGDARPKLIYLEWRAGFFQGKACGPDSEALLKSMNYKLILKKTADRMYIFSE